MCVYLILACSDAMADCVLCSSASTCEVCSEAMFFDTDSSTCRGNIIKHLPQMRLLCQVHLRNSCFFNVHIFK